MRRTKSETMKGTVGRLLAASSLLFLLVCSGCGRAARGLRDNRELWASRHLSSYRYTLKRGCFCQPDTTTPIVIEVRDGQQVSITRPGSTIENSEQFYPYDTVEKLFEIAEMAVSGKPDKLSIEYDREFGYPSRISIDPDKSMYDEEFSLTVSGFQLVH